MPRYIELDKAIEQFCSYGSVFTYGDNVCKAIVSRLKQVPTADVVERKVGNMTNADRIRSMTDEELADFLERWELGDIDYSKTFCDLCKGQYDCHDDCLLDWLKKAEMGERRDDG